MIVQTTIGERIRLARKRSGMTQGAISEKLGIARQNVSAWENGLNSPNAEFVLRMSRAFDCDFYWLMFGEFYEPKRKYGRETYLREDTTKYKEDNNEP